ncbi:MAG: DNA polymerase III subunit beta [Patescibacteria group bacterium]
MDFECVQNKLRQAVQKSNQVVSRSIDLPILSCVLMTTTGDKLLLQSTDIEHALTVTIPARIHQEGRVAVQSDVINRILQGVNSKDEHTKITLDKQELVVSTSLTESRITTQDDSDFPTIPHIETDEGTVSVSISTEDFLRGLEVVSFAASHSNIKPELSSVYVYYEAGRLTFVCTDGFRLAEQVIIVDLGALEFDFLLPVKSAGIIQKLFDDYSKEDLTIYITDNQLAIKNKQLYFTCRLVSGNFPDYKKLIPTEHETSTVMLKEDLASVLKLSNIFSNEYHEVVLNIDPSKKLCELSSSNKEVGSNRTNIPAVLEGDPVTVTFNYRFLNEALPVVHTDSVQITFTDPGRPLKLTTIPESAFTYIVMPLNT